MTPRSPLARVAAACALGATLAACGDNVDLKELEAGISADSAAVVLGGKSGIPPSSPSTAGADTLANIYRKETFLANGTMYDVYYYHSSGKKESRDTVPESELTPIVFENSKLTGRGWAYWDSVAKSIKVPLRSHD